MTPKENAIDLRQRDLRQRELVPPERLADCRATVVGVGAIGRQVALQLAAVGVPWMQLIDPDTVEVVNLAPQGYMQDDFGCAKVHATGGSCHELNHGLELYTHKCRFRRNMKIGNLLFNCVDSINTRRLIWEAVRDRIDFYADGRMAAEVLRVLAVSDEPSRRHYPTTLFAAEEAYAGSCTSKSTIFCANVAAGLMLAQFTKYLRGLPIEPDIQLNLLAMELTVTPTK